MNDDADRAVHQIEGEGPRIVSGVVEPDTGRLLREVQRPQTFERPASTQTEMVLKGVSALKFSYTGIPQELPYRVSVRIEYSGRFGARAIDPLAEQRHRSRTGGFFFRLGTEARGQDG